MPSPALVAAGITAATTLVGGTLAQKAAREKERRDRILAAIQLESEGQKRAQQQLLTGTQGAISQGLSGFGQALR